MEKGKVKYRKRLSMLYRPGTVGSIYKSSERRVDFADSYAACNDYGLNMAVHRNISDGIKVKGIIFPQSGVTDIFSRSSGTVTSVLAKKGTT
jgi:hypothetical protein